MGRSVLSIPFLCLNLASGTTWMPLTIQLWFLPSSQVRKWEGELSVVGDFGGPSSKPRFIFKTLSADPAHTLKDRPEASKPILVQAGPFAVKE